MNMAQVMDLNYETVVSTKHTITVRTWTVDEVVHYRVIVDGVTRDEGTLEETE